MKLLLKLIFGCFLLAAGLGVALGLYAATLLPELPTIEDIRRAPLNIPLRVYNSERQLLAEYGNERRIPLSLDDAPPLLIDALLATEDDGFYHHGGVDFRGILRAGWSNLRSKSRGQGASTITMQVARNFFLTPEKTYTRKLKEVLLAFNMERALTKDDILEMYLNKIFLGHRAYGFAAAAQVYYDAELKDLSLPEISMLAGLPKAPSRDNPITNPQRAAERRAYVLKRLHLLGKIDDLSYHTARAAPITAARGRAEIEARAPYVAEMARRTMVEHFGERVYDLGIEVTLSVRGDYQARADQSLRDGLLAYDRRHGFRGAIGTIDLDAHTPESLAEALRLYPSSRELIPAAVRSVEARTIHARTQTGEAVRIEWDGIEWARAYHSANRIGAKLHSASEAVAPGDVVHVAPTTGDEGDGGDGWRLAQMPKVSGALVSLDPDSGAVLALAGGFDYYLSKFNRATQAQRQPGSNIKPFIYSAALEHGFTPGSLVSAAPVVVEDEFEGVWRPQNYSKKFFGPTRLRKALSLSLNLVSVRLVRAIGIEPTIEHLAKFGFDPAQLPRSLSLALGSIAATPIDLAAAFAVFANGGHRVKPYLIERIVDRDGEEVVLSESECAYCRLAGDAAGNAAGERERAISPQNAYLMRSMLQQVIRSGTGQRALVLGRDDLAGKTGTTNNFRDAWFSGFSPDVITTVFVGFDEPAHLGRRESGASAALPIWVDFMRAVLPDFPERPSEIPERIVSRYINQDSGKPTAEDDPDGYLEYYIAGTEPTGPAEPVAAGDASAREKAAGELF
ncbi:MAG: penicillin-binding protein 1A [bacterium]